MTEQTDTPDPGDAQVELTSAVCASDALVRETLDAAIEASDFTIAYSVGNAPDLIRLATDTPVSLVVLDNELAGMLGVDWIESVRDAAPGTTVLLVTNDLTQALNDRAMEAGAFGVVHKTRLQDLNGALGRAHSWLRTGADVEAGERRSGTDRRHHQDWQQVTHERRSGSDRRGNDLRPTGESA